MRAHITTTITRPRRRARHVLPLALGICALAIPATASAYTDPGGYSSGNAITGGTEEPSQSIGGPDYSSVTALTGGSEQPSQPARDAGYSSVNAITAPPSGEPIVVSGPPAGPSEGFDWGDAALGAGAALSLVAFGGAALLTVRRRTAISPSAS